MSNQLKPSAAGDASKRNRGSTTIDFQTASTGVAAKAMRNELNRMASNIQDPEAKRIFGAEMEDFFLLFNRYLTEKAKGEKMYVRDAGYSYQKVQNMLTEMLNDPQRMGQGQLSPAERILPYTQLDSLDPAMLDKLVVLRLNGGLGTTMGCQGPKSVIEVRDGLTFLDLCVRQIEHLNETYNVNVPFILMSSFNTAEDTDRVIQKYENHNINILTFNQSKYPRVNRDTLLPVAKEADSDNAGFYPPGHGNVLDALNNSGLLDQLIAAGKEYIFVSNVDNLGATVDLNIYQQMIDSQAEYLMELTDKTKADVKGGTLIDYEGNLRLLEVAQVPSDHLEEFKNVNKFKIFNTNSVWMKLTAMKRVLDNDELDLEIIVNNKVTPKGEPVIQLETAIGAAIKHFRNAIGVNVPRSRFLPVKSCSDLLLIKSGLYTMEHGQLTMNKARQFSGTPVIKLGDQFKKVSDFERRVKGGLNIVELDHLTVNGDVHIGKNCTFAGTVIIIATDGNKITIPDGSRLENKLVTGSLAIIDH